MNSRYSAWSERMINNWKSNGKSQFIMNCTGMQLAFLQILRNGTTTIRYLIKPWRYCKPSVPAARKQLDACLRVAVIREPYSRFISSFSRLTTAGRKGAQLRRLPYAQIDDPVKSFEQFVMDVDKRIFDNHLIQQHICVEDCDMDIDEWIPLERLTTTLKQWASKYGYDVKNVVVRNGTTNLALKRRLLKLLLGDRDLKAVVDRIYEKDFELYERVKG